MICCGDSINLQKGAIRKVACLGLRVPWVEDYESQTCYGITAVGTGNDRIPAFLRPLLEATGVVQVAAVSKACSITVSADRDMQLRILRGSHASPKEPHAKHGWCFYSSRCDAGTKAGWDSVSAYLSSAFPGDWPDWNDLGSFGRRFFRCWSVAWLSPPRRVRRLTTMKSPGCVILWLCMLLCATYLRLMVVFRVTLWLGGTWRGLCERSVL